MSEHDWDHPIEWQTFPDGSTGGIMPARLLAAPNSAGNRTILLRADDRYGDKDQRDLMLSNQTKDRIAACWSACRGISDPEAAIKAARAALDRVEGVLEENWRNKGIGETYEALTDVRTALALLGEGAE